MSNYFKTWKVDAGASTDLVRPGGELNIREKKDGEIRFKATGMGTSGPDGKRDNNKIWKKVKNAQIVTVGGVELMQGTIKGHKGMNPFTMIIAGEEKAGQTIQCAITRPEPSSSKKSAMMMAASGDDDDGSWEGEPT